MIFARFCSTGLFFVKTEQNICSNAFLEKKITGNFDGNFAVLPFRFLFFKNFFLKPIDRVGILVYIIFDPHPVGEVYGERKRKEKKNYAGR